MRDFISCLKSITNVFSPACLLSASSRGEGYYEKEAATEKTQDVNSNEVTLVMIVVMIVVMILVMVVVMVVVLIMLTMEIMVMIKIVTMMMTAITGWFF